MVVLADCHGGMPMAGAHDFRCVDGREPCIVSIAVYYDFFLRDTIAHQEVAHDIGFFKSLYATAAADNDCFDTVCSKDLDGAL